MACSSRPADGPGGVTEEPTVYLLLLPVWATANQTDRHQEGAYDGRPLRQGQRRHLKHLNHLFKFDKLFRDVIGDPEHRENMTSWIIADEEKVELGGNI